MTTAYRAVEVWFQGEPHWAVEISRPGRKPEPHGYYSSQAEAQAEADRLAALSDDLKK
jgi:hypothetical protein